MIDELRKIGLSDLEARCYLVLHEDPKISGYEVAKKCPYPARMCMRPCVL